MNFGENLKLIRNQKKMSQEALAEKVGVSRQSVSKWEVGEAYPEMNNILQLCKIFNCKINDLVHEDMSDFNSLDKEIISNVVKFKKQQQKKMKTITRIAYIISRIAKIITIICISTVTISALFIPSTINHTKVSNGNIIIGNNNFQITPDTNNYNKVVEVFNNNSNLKIILVAEFIIISLIVTMYLGYRIFKKLDEVFTNIHNGETPFTLTNINSIKSISKSYIILLILPNICSYIGQFILGLDVVVELLTLTEFITILVVVSISYVFEYGYEIQKDSKGVMYDK